MNRVNLKLLTVLSVLGLTPGFNAHAAPLKMLHSPRVIANTPVQNQNAWNQGIHQIVENFKNQRISPEAKLALDQRFPRLANLDQYRVRRVENIQQQQPKKDRIQEVFNLVQGLREKRMARELERQAQRKPEAELQPAEKVSAIKAHLGQQRVIEKANPGFQIHIQQHGVAAPQKVEPQKNLLTPAQREAILRIQQIQQLQQENAVVAKKQHEPREYQSRQDYPKQYNPSNFHIAKVHACCTSIRTGLPAPRGEHAIPGDFNTDPYFATSAPSASDLPRKNLGALANQIGYQYQRPTHLNMAKPLQSFTYRIPKASIQERRDEVIRELGYFPGSPTSEISTYLGAGSMSKAYAVHPPVPQGLSASERKAWAIANAIDVIKVRVPNPFGEKQNNIQLAAAMQRRDLIVQDLFNQCASRFRILENGVYRPLIEVVKYKDDSSSERVQKGILRQDIVQGVSVADLAKSVQLAKHRGPYQAESERFVYQQGFRNIEDAERKLQALHAFYHETHADVLNFYQQNGIEGTANSGRSGRNLGIGFDYNHGQNVIWDTRTLTFKAIDF
jgi:hypothetical protein